MDYHESLLLRERLCQANAALLNSPWLSCTDHSEQKVRLTNQEYVLSNNKKKNPQIIILMNNLKSTFLFCMSEKYQNLALKAFVYKDL